MSMLISWLPHQCCNTVALEAKNILKLYQHVFPQRAQHFPAKDAWRSFWQSTLACNSKLSKHLNVEVGNDGGLFILQQSAAMYAIAETDRADLWNSSITWMTITWQIGQNKISLTKIGMLIQLPSHCTSSLWFEVSVPKPRDSSVGRKAFLLASH